MMSAATPKRRRGFRLLAGFPLPFRAPLSGSAAEARPGDVCMAAAPSAARRFAVWYWLTRSPYDVCGLLVEKDAISGVD